MTTTPGEIELDVCLLRDFKHGPIRPPIRDFFDGRNLAHVINSTDVLWSSRGFGSMGLETMVHLVANPPFVFFARTSNPVALSLASRVDCVTLTTSQLLPSVCDPEDMRHGRYFGAERRKRRFGTRLILSTNGRI